MLKLIVCTYFVLGVILSIILFEIVLWGGKKYGDEAPNCRELYNEVERYKSSGHLSVILVAILLMACMWPGWILFILFYHGED